MMDRIRVEITYNFSIHKKQSSLIRIIEITFESFRAVQSCTKVALGKLLLCFDIFGKVEINFSIKMTISKVAVIGGGLAGLCSAKNALANGLQVTLYEQTGGIGGTWNYTEKTGRDEYGLKIHSSMYRGLR